MTKIMKCKNGCFLWVLNGSHIEYGNQFLQNSFFSLTEGFQNKIIEGLAKKHQQTVRDLLKKRAERMAVYNA